MLVSGLSKRIVLAPCLFERQPLQLAEWVFPVTNRCHIGAIPLQYRCNLGAVHSTCASEAR